MSELIPLIGILLAVLVLLGLVAYLKFSLDEVRFDLDYIRNRLRELERNVGQDISAVQEKLDKLVETSTAIPAEPHHGPATVGDYVTVYKASKALHQLLGNVEAEFDGPVAQRPKKPINLA